MVICSPKELASPDKLSDNRTDKLSDILPRNLGDKFETSNENFMNNMLTPAIKEGFVRMLHPESPHHPRQKYLLTVKGMGLLSNN